MDVVRILGSTAHSEEDREETDFYATDPDSLTHFLNRITLDNIHLNKHLWENACGMGHLAEVLQERGHHVLCTDILDRGWSDALLDFTRIPTSLKFCGDIITNPPYKHATEFVEGSINSVHDGSLVVMYLRLQFVEGKKRRKLFDKYPPKYIYVHSERQQTYKSGLMNTKKSSAICFAWFIWQRGFSGDTTLRWI